MFLTILSGKCNNNEKIPLSNRRTMKNKILTFTLERQSKDQEWGLSLVGGWMEGQWIQVSQVQCTVGQSPKGMVYFLELAIIRVAGC